MLTAEFLAGRRKHLENKLKKVLSESDDLEQRRARRLARPEEVTLLGMKRDIAQRIEHAIGRLDGGTYGTCLTCGREIPRPRLERMPDAPTCVPCDNGRLP